MGKEERRKKHNLSCKLSRDRQDLENNPGLAYLAEKRLTAVAKQKAKEVFPSPPNKTKQNRTLDRKRKSHREDILNRFLTMSHSEENKTIFGVPASIYRSWPVETQLQRARDWEDRQAARERQIHQDAIAQRQELNALHSQHTYALQQHTYALQQHTTGAYLTALQRQGADVSEAIRAFANGAENGFVPFDGIGGHGHQAVLTRGGIVDPPRPVRQIALPRTTNGSLGTSDSFGVGGYGAPTVNSRGGMEDRGGVQARGGVQDQDRGGVQDRGGIQDHGGVQDQARGGVQDQDRGGVQDRGGMDGHAETIDSIDIQSGHENDIIKDDNPLPDEAMATVDALPDGALTDEAALPDEAADTESAATAADTHTASLFSSMWERCQAVMSAEALATVPLLVQQALTQVPPFVEWGAVLPYIAAAPPSMLPFVNSLKSMLSGGASLDEQAMVRRTGMTPDHYSRQNKRRIPDSPTPMKRRKRMNPMEPVDESRPSVFERLQNTSTAASRAAQTMPRSASNSSLSSTSTKSSIPTPSTTNSAKSKASLARKTPPLSAAPTRRTAIHTPSGGVSKNRTTPGSASSANAKTSGSRKVPRSPTSAYKASGMRTVPRTPGSASTKNSAKKASGTGSTRTTRATRSTSKNKSDFGDARS